MGLLIGLQPSEVRRCTIPDLMALADGHARAHDPDGAAASRTPGPLDDAAATRFAALLQEIAPP